MIGFGRSGSLLRSVDVFIVVALGGRWLVPSNALHPRIPHATPCSLLRRLTMDDAAEASHTFALLMGDKVAPRRQLIEQYGSRLSLEQLDV